MLATPKTISTLDLFAGAGGLSLGFEQAGLGFEPTFAVEMDPAAARTFKAHFGCEVYDGSIEDISTFPIADVIVGGPPVRASAHLDATETTSVAPSSTSCGSTSCGPCVR